MENIVTTAWHEMNQRLTSFVHSKVKDPERTKDIVQDVFLKAFSKSDSLRDKQKLTSWIYQITRNEIVTHFRSLEKEGQLSQYEIAALEEEEYMTGDLAVCMHPLLDSIGDIYKEALQLSDIENIPQKELAERLGISYSGLKSRVQRGRAMLKEAYEQCCLISVDQYGNVLEYHSKVCSSSSSKKCKT